MPSIRPRRSPTYSTIGRRFSASSRRRSSAPRPDTPQAPCPGEDHYRGCSRWPHDHPDTSLTDGERPQSSAHVDREQVVDGYPATPSQGRRSARGGAAGCGRSPRSQATATTCRTPPPSSWRRPRSSSCSLVARSGRYGHGAVGYQPRGTGHPTRDAGFSILAELVATTTHDRSPFYVVGHHESPHRPVTSWPSQCAPVPVVPGSVMCKARAVERPGLAATIVCMIAVEPNHLKWIWWEHWDCRRCGRKNKRYGCRPKRWIAVALNEALARMARVAGSRLGVTAS